MVRDRGGSAPGEHPGLQAGLWLPIFDELAHPKVVAGLAAEAEQAGWHGVFVWDHLRWREPVRQVADPWITLAAAAVATGATWWLTDFAPEAVSLDEVRGVLRDGPPEPAVTGT